MFTSMHGSRRCKGAQLRPLRLVSAVRDFLKLCKLRGVRFHCKQFMYLSLGSIGSLSRLELRNLLEFTCF